jgi:mono/diheme cytochrome c family protein
VAHSEPTTTRKAVLSWSLACNLASRPYESRSHKESCLAEVCCAGAATVGEAVIRRISISALALAFLAVSGVWLLSLRTAIPPLDPTAKKRFSAETVSRGEALAAAAHCASCHTRASGPVFAGGCGVNTPFGIIYGTNITPDPETGIGLWSLEAFTRAMREGLSRDGSHLFAAFPYWAYTKMSDEDVQALYAFLMIQLPVSATAPPNTIPCSFKTPCTPGRLEDFILQARAVPEGCVKKRRVESRSIPGRGRSRLFGLSHTAECTRRRDNAQRLRGRLGRRMDRSSALRVVSSKNRPRQHRRRLRSGRTDTQTGT